jgi:hypothetical protein
VLAEPNAGPMRAEVPVIAAMGGGFQP